MYISEIFKLEKGHESFEFVDINLGNDTALFLDPCLIQVGKTDFCKSAMKTMTDYFDKFYSLYRDKSTYEEKYYLFEHAHEINATKLGYGNGNNGKAKTPEGLITTFSAISYLMPNIPLSNPIDLSVFIDNFAEDCMSDLLTNILFDELNNFTIKQCKRYGLSTRKPNKTFYYWNVLNSSWEIFTNNCLIIDEKIILLVPKNIIRKKYYYNINQYFSMIILDRLQKERALINDKGNTEKPYKKDLSKEILSIENSIWNASIKKTKEKPELLLSYHKMIPSFYSNRNMLDEELDKFIYIK